MHSSTTTGAQTISVPDKLVSLGSVAAVFGLEYNGDIIPFPPPIQLWNMSFPILTSYNNWLRGSYMLDFSSSACSDLLHSYSTPLPIQLFTLDSVTNTPAVS